MKQIFWFKICPLCKQGRLFVFKNLSNGKLYLHCEECEQGYYNPNELNKENAFLTLTENFEATEATAEDIKEFKWDRYDLIIEKSI